MKTAPALPYLLPPESCVSDHPWLTPDGAPVPERLEHWDPFADTLLVRVVELDADEMRRACGLGPDATFAIASSWYASRTRLSGRGDVVELGTTSGTVSASIEMSVPGAAAGGRLDLRTTVVLRYAGSGASMISPRREGAILWSDRARVALEGAAARFPVTASDFSSSNRLPDRAGWALEWDPEELEAPVLGGLRLLVNTADEDLLEALRSGSRDARATVIRSFVTFDVARSLVHSVLLNESFVDDPERFEEGSTGRMLFELLALAWPGMPVRALRSRLFEDAPRLDAELQAYLGTIG